MKMFLVFWNSSFDQQDVAEGYVVQARLHAKAINKTILARLIDVTGNDPDKKYWDSPQTIECVTVNDGGKVRTALNPSDSEINDMVDAL